MSKLGIVIPYRDRLPDLDALHAPLVKSLGRNNFEIIISEQCDAKPFNRGLSNNIGIKAAIDSGATHAVTHDVDSIPLRADYTPCKHIARLCGIFNGRCTPSGNGGPYLGGIVMLSLEAVRITDGYPNKLFGWGHEDDILRERAWKNGAEIEYRCGFYMVRDHPRDLSKYWENGVFCAQNKQNLGGVSSINNMASFEVGYNKFGTHVKFTCF